MGMLIILGIGGSYIMSPGKQYQYGETLKQLRTVNGFTQEQIGDYLGVDQSLVSKIEHGERGLNLTILEKLCNLYDITDIKLLENDLTDYTPLNIQGEVVDLNAIAKMNEIKNDLELLRRLDEDD